MKVQKIILLLYLLTAAKTDIKRKEISMFEWSIITVILFTGGLLTNGIKAVCFGMIPGILLLILSKLTKEAIGYGDGCVIMSCGMVLGLSKVFGLLLLALLIQIPFALWHIIIKKCGRKTEMAFLPFVLAAYLTVLI